MSNLESTSTWTSAPNAQADTVPANGTAQAASAFSQMHPFERVEETIQRVESLIAPVWPLQDYVAVNPYRGLADRSFMDARAFLRIFSDCETLMPLAHFAAQFHAGKFSKHHIAAAIEELDRDGMVKQQRWNAKGITDQLQSYPVDDVLLEDSVPRANTERGIRTVSQYIDQTSDFDWSKSVLDEISRHCGAYYDEGQSSWAYPWQHLPLYQAWREAAQVDRNFELLGVPGFRQHVSQLPHSPKAALVQLLQQLNVPEALWETFLLCQSFALPGWSAWAKYQVEQAESNGRSSDDFIALLAIRLAYDVALASHHGLSIDWASLGEDAVTHTSEQQAPGDDAYLRLTLLRAIEIAQRDSVLAEMDTSHASPSESSARPLAQMVFCIDVRSERFRRQLESVTTSVETMGFAGFFGIPLEFVPFGAEDGHSHVPALIQPSFQAHECLVDHDGHKDASRIEASKVKRGRIRTVRKLWKQFQTSAAGCFPFVESTGLFNGFTLLRRSLAWTSSTKPCSDGIEAEDRSHLRPDLTRLADQGLDTQAQVTMVESALTNLSLTDGFGRLVVFCGHGCQTENNPLEAGLDCGACGGHSGEPNARFAAMLLNAPEVREGLKERGMEVPEDTWFIGAKHNTTTDEVTLHDVDLVPASHRDDIVQLRQSLATASSQTRRERQPTLDGEAQSSDSMRRARDWAEVRPEWGLAGNSLFIVAPRDVSKSINLNGRAFLHDYRAENDPEGKVLEGIMTAPMVVTNWINLQYYASTVDQPHFGSGSKTVHNVVGGFGVLSGNAGDLQTGLPWQSLHDGTRFQHTPQRLQVVITAPRSRIESILERNEDVANLVHNGWLHLVAIDEAVPFRRTPQGTWEPLESHAAATAA
ncbi:MAG: DUF2309 domain-containing protein [Planctomycetota bacterium]